MNAIIIEREANKFAHRLQDAGSKFIETLKDGQEALADKIERVDRVANSTFYAAEQAHGAAIEAGGAAEEAMVFADEATDIDDSQSTEKYLDIQIGVIRVNG